MEKTYCVSDKYLLLPVQTGGENRRLEVFSERGAKLFEFQIPVRECGEADYFAAIPSARWKERKLVLKGDFPEQFFQAVHFLPEVQSGVALCHADNEADSEACGGGGRHRPLLHFTPEAGWINDPNGLVYWDDMYHLYFQYNPFDTRWENMCWGHAVSRDLLCWTQQETALFPDEHGTAFSGSGIVNERGMLGLPSDALIFFYTAAGDNSLWSRGKTFTQRMAYSLDGGKTLLKTDAGVVETICRENRDPKVFWHKESRAYIMVLWLEENDFGIFRSQDLCNWTMSQRLTLGEAWECPDLVRVSVERGNAAEKSAWVFLTADGFYYWGDFDGYRFETDCVRRTAYMNKIPYAAQTYSNVKNRTIFVPWLRLPNRGQFYTGAMGLPRELTALETGGERKLRLLPVREYEAKKREVILPSGTLHYQKSGVAAELLLWLSSGDKVLELTVNDTNIRIDSRKGELKVGEEFGNFPAGVRDFSLLVDEVILEVTADYGTIVGVFELASPGVDIRMDSRGAVAGLYEIEI